MVAFRDVDKYDAARLYGVLHPYQRREIRSSLGHDIERCILNCVNRSKEAYTVTEDNGQVLAMFGIVPLSILDSDRATPWMVSSSNISNYPRKLLTYSRMVIDHWRNQYDYMFNYIDNRYYSSLRWAKKIGFTVHPAEPYGIEQLPFNKIDMRNN